MGRLSRSILLLALVADSYAKKAEVVVESNGMIGDMIDSVTGLVFSIWDTTLGLATDVMGLLQSVPSVGVDLYAWVAGVARSIPDLVKGAAFGDAATLSSMSSFASRMAVIIFCVYASLTALNLAVGVGLAARDYIASYLDLPTSLPGMKKLPGPVKQVRDIIQKELLNRIKGFTVSGWIVPLEGQSGKPSLDAGLNTLAQATAVCVFLGCAPAIHAIIEKGADKKAAEDLAYTLGMAIGMLYLVKKV